MPTADTTFDTFSRKWTRLDRETSTPDHLLDINVTDLINGSAWQFDIKSSQAVDEARLSPQLVAFADSIRIEAIAARKQVATEIFVRMKPLQTLKYLRQRVSYNYNIKNTDYVLELSRFQDKSYPARKYSLGPEEHPALYEPRWSINVYREQWDTMFATHEHLAIGTSVDWAADPDTWFPEDMLASPAHDALPGRGFEAMLEKLRMVEQLLRSPEEILTAGMTVGW